MPNYRRFSALVFAVNTFAATWIVVQLYYDLTFRHDLIIYLNEIITLKRS